MFLHQTHSVHPPDGLLLRGLPPWLHSLHFAVGQHGCAAVTAAANAWNDAGADFAYVYGGATTATTASQNGINEIFWGTVSTGALAYFNRWYVSANQLAEVDIVLNNTFPWSATAESEED